MAERAGGPGKFDTDLFGRPLPMRQLDLGLSVGTVHLSRLTQALSGLRGGSSTGLTTLEIPEAELGTRWARALRAVYPSHTAKRAARDLMCELRTAEGWLAGQAPQLKYFLRALKRHGAGLLAAMADPGSPLALAADLDEIEARLNRLAQVIRQAKEDPHG